MSLVSVAAVLVAVALTPKQVHAQGGDAKRGEYLIQVAGCGGCHGAFRLAQDGKVPLAGGNEFKAGQLGTYYAPNLTVGVKQMPLDIFEKAVRRGIAPFTERVMAVMPKFSRLSDSDVASLHAYLSSLPDVKNDVPDAQPGPGASNLKAGPEASVPDAKTDDSAEAGQYWVEAVARCGGCHSPGVQGRDLAGGVRNLGSEEAPIYAPPILGTVLTAAGYSPETFAQAMRTGKHPWGSPMRGQMPWRRFANMTDTDLLAIWNFLQTKKLDSPWPIATPEATPAQ
jgi:mono/diheme cytochrome c family protein